MYDTMIAKFSDFLSLFYKAEGENAFKKHTSFSLLLPQLFFSRNDIGVVPVQLLNRVVKYAWEE